MLWTELSKVAWKKIFQEMLEIACPNMIWAVGSIIWRSLMQSEEDGLPVSAQARSRTILRRMQMLRQLKKVAWTIFQEILKRALIKLIRIISL